MSESVSSSVQDQQGESLHWPPAGELPTEGRETRLQRDSEYFVSEEEALAQRILKWQQDVVEQEEVAELESEWTSDSQCKPSGSRLPFESIVPTFDSKPHHETHPMDLPPPHATLAGEALLTKKPSPPQRATGYKPSLPHDSSFISRVSPTHPGLPHHAGVPIESSYDLKTAPVKDTMGRETSGDQRYSITQLTNVPFEGYKPSAEGESPHKPSGRRSPCCILQEDQKRKAKKRWSMEEYVMTVDKSSSQCIKSEIKEERGVREEIGTARDSSEWRQQTGFAGVKREDITEDSIRSKQGDEISADSVQPAATKENVQRVQGESNLKEDFHKSQESKRIKEVATSTGGSLPVFVKEISSLNVKISEMSEFTCQFHGDPLPTVTWLKDGHPLAHNPDYDIMSKSNTSKLTIYYPTTDHEGTYDCVITNKHGKSICSATLEISDKKESFRSSPVEIRITAATPVPEMTEESIEEKSQAFTEKTSDVPIDEGASQTVKHKFTFSFDVAGEAPRVNSELDNITCSEGHTAILECVITGEPAAEMLWFCDDVCLKITGGKYRVEVDDKLYRLYINSFTYTDAGVYKCVARNTLGEVASISDVSFQVAEPVRISKAGGAEEDDGFAEDIKKPSESPELVRPKPQKPVCFTLQKEEGEGQMLGEDTFHTFDRTGSFIPFQSEKVPAVKRSVKASAPPEEAVKPKIISKSFKPVRQSETTMSLSIYNEAETVSGASLVEGLTEVEQQGLKTEGCVLMPGIQPSTGDSSEKFFSPVQFLASPADDCIETINLDENQFLTRGRGSLGLVTLQEKVQGIPPAFLKPLIKKRMFENESLTFCAEVFGLPSPEVKWFCNKTQLVAAERVIMERDGDSISLTILNVTKADQGEYICEAVNYVGEARSVALVVVVSQEVRFLPAPPAVTHQHVMEFDVEEDDSSRSPSPQEILLEPVFLSQLSPAAVTTGETARFTIKVSGFPKPTVQWSHNGKEIKSSSIYQLIEEREEYMLVITKVTSEYEGEYSCTATNRFGQTTCTTYLEVKKPDVSQAEKWVEKMFKITGQPPTFTVQIQPVRCLEGGEVYFNYKASGDPVPDVKWFKGAFQIQPSRNYVITVNPDGSGSIYLKSIKQEDSGLYTCKASNRFGEAACSAELVVSDGLHHRH
uniref:Ig-like domain-containing protein n=1 Tax=Scophthalmus maximus TaxID=52904 RepID=A0A8D3DPX9_SCOMX